MADFNPNDRSTWPQWRLQAEQDRHERAESMTDGEGDHETPDNRVGYNDALCVFRDLLDPNIDEVPSEYVRGGVNLIADLFGIVGRPTDERMDDVELDLRRIPMFADPKNLAQYGVAEYVHDDLAGENLDGHVADDKWADNDELPPERDPQLAEPLSHGALVAFVREVADLPKEGERPNDSDEKMWEMGEAFHTLHEIISDARDLLARGLHHIKPTQATPTQATTETDN